MMFSSGEARTQLIALATKRAGVPMETRCRKRREADWHRLPLSGGRRGKHQSGQRFSHQCPRGLKVNVPSLCGCLHGHQFMNLRALCNF
jgi:hypothetical protein